MTAGVTLRPASPGDAALLHAWVNADDSLRWKARTSGPVPWDGHLAWYAQRLADPHCMIRIVLVDGAEAGQVRLWGDPAAPEVDIYVAPAFRGRGAASVALRTALASWADTFGATRPRAVVKATNAASLRLFAALGFVEERRDAELIELVHPAVAPARDP